MVWVGEVGPRHTLQTVSFRRTMCKFCAGIRIRDLTQQKLPFNLFADNTELASNKIKLKIWRI